MKCPINLFDTVLKIYTCQFYLVLITIFTHEIMCNVTIFLQQQENYMNKRRFILSLLVFLSIGSSFASSSGEVFKKYVSGASCRVNRCAKSIPSGVLRSFFEKVSDINSRKLETTTYAFIIDFNQHSKNKRGHLLNLKNGTVESFHVSHGKGSDRNHDGIADKFSNVDGSNMSSLGLYLTAETYHGKHGLSLKLDGQEGTNDNARSRYIVMHGASYMSNSFINQHGKAGRSQGCPAVNNNVRTELINKLKGGSLYYIHKG